MSEEASTPVHRERTLLFRVEAERFGLPLSSVVEVLELVTAPVPIPGAPGWVSGVFNHHGQVIPVIRMRSFLGTGAARHQDGAEEDPRKASQVILVDLDEGHFGLVVDQIESIEEIRTEGAGFQGRKRSWHRGTLLELLEPSWLLEDIHRRLSGPDSIS
jgi:purine-binding chemotaxis protein CheW